MSTPSLRRPGGGSPRSSGSAATVYLARAAVPVRASYLQGAFRKYRLAKPATGRLLSSTWFPWRLTPDLLPTPFRYLSDALPLAQAVNATRDVAYFRGSDITEPTVLLLLWMAIAASTVAIARLQQPHPPQLASTVDRRLPQRKPVPEPLPAWGSTSD